MPLVVLVCRVGQEPDVSSLPCEIKAFALLPNISNMIYFQICDPLYIDRFFRRVRLFQNQQKRQHQQRTAKRSSRVFSAMLVDNVFLE